MSATALKRTPSPVLSWNRFYEYNFCSLISLKHPFGHVLHNRFNFIKKRIQHRCFTINFAKLLKTLCRTPPVSASNFNSTFLTLRPSKTYIFVFPALHFWIFLSHFTFFIEDRNKSIWFYTKFPVKQALFLTS